ncbi:efflux transporter outer membrane subunit [Stutzerimonas zhaodongensis]|uniref:efflux transporter outer membrane subunit n=1 Tax=Stutzerimonas zhaodongensis TaxID=1176257 RepID=UPI0021083ED1|nr:efflux transporter outer membrane subunit [Stutzerimonas zhaodongensis]MCQ2031223.1 efflux transporter outer membrane subunit [Stutzerimonas zhaodongensis]
MNPHARTTLWVLCPLLLAVALSACAPARQATPPEAQFEAPNMWRDGLAGQTVIQAQWWEGFGDPQLSHLVETALASNTDILTAVARVDEARAQIQMALSSLLPWVDAVIGGQRTRDLGTTGIQRTTAIQPELQVSYEVDVWGRLGRLRDAAELGYQASEAERDAVRLAVASTTARAYISLLSLDRQLQVTRQTTESRLEALRVARDRASLGYTSQLELTQAQSEYEAAAQLIPELEQAIRQQENAVRLLIGEQPGPVTRGCRFDEIAFPLKPTALPSELLRRRPDIRQAELLLAASDLNLDAERDRFLPQVQLSASIGQLFVNSLDYDPVRVWGLGGSVLAPLFSGGRLEAGVGIATAQRDQAAYGYRAAALNAFSEVENALSGIEQFASQAERVKARREILARSLAIAQDRYRGGYSSYLEELDAQRNLFNTELAVIQIEENRINNLISLYQALGGGWQADANR